MGLCRADEPCVWVQENPLPTLPLQAGQPSGSPFFLQDLRLMNVGNAIYVENWQDDSGRNPIFILRSGRIVPANDDTRAALTGLGRLAKWSKGTREQILALIELDVGVANTEASKEKERAARRALYELLMNDSVYDSMTLRARKDNESPGSLDMGALAMAADYAYGIDVVDFAEALRTGRMLTFASENRLLARDVSRLTADLAEAYDAEYAAQVAEEKLRQQQQRQQEQR